MQNTSNKIEIVKVKTKKQQKEFLNFPLNLYKNNPYFVPPLYMDEKQIFKKNYVYYETCEAIYYNAYIDGKIVGRISGILQKASNEKWKQKRIRFTRFDCIDNQQVANALFDAIKNWAKEKQMDEIVGPLGFSDLEREGLLIEGFDQLSTFEEQYNYPYYQTLIENYGFEKEVDWLERKLYLPTVKDERLEKLSTLMLEKYNLKFAKTKSINEFIKKYANKFFDIIDVTYENIYGSVPFTKATRKMMINNFKLIVNLKNVAVIVDENDDVVCFGICFPSIAKAVQKTQGKMTLGMLFRILKAIKNPDVIDLGLIGVIPKYAQRGIASALISSLMKMLEQDGLDHAETNLNLETNVHIINQWKSFNSVLHKKRRAFVLKVE